MMIVYEKFFLVVLWTENSDRTFKKTIIVKLLTNQSEVSALTTGKDKSTSLASSSILLPEKT